MTITISKIEEVRVFLLQSSPMPTCLFQIRYLKPVLLKPNRSGPVNISDQICLWTGADIIKPWLIWLEPATPFAVGPVRFSTLPKIHQTFATHAASTRLTTRTSTHLPAVQACALQPKSRNNAKMVAMWIRTLNQSDPAM